MHAVIPFQVLLEQYFFTQSHTSSENSAPLSFELLSKSLSLYIRLCMHKRIEPRRGSKVKPKRKNGLRKDSSSLEEVSGDERRESLSESDEFEGEIMEVLDWCGRVVVPALNDSFAKG